MKRAKLTITGIVQGVGFRPFVYNLARQCNLGGWVLNDAGGVQIEAEGKSQDVEAFIEKIKTNRPAQAVIVTIAISQQPLKGETAFIIKQSVAGAARSTFVSPDLATCSQCQQEIAEAGNRRFQYAFTNCTNCGPRYSIVEDIPYDRVNTTMREFTMCPACQAEYDDPHDRRFHAQPNACPTCGPSYVLSTKEGQTLPGDWLPLTRKLIGGGAILAVKGIGGYHLVCDGRNEAAVKTLRARKVREDKPFAVMCGSLEAVRQQCLLSTAEEKLLAGPIRPVVLLQKQAGYQLAQAVAPDNPNLGVMLPYAPVHFLLLAAEDVWVMTSGNTSEEPIAYQDEDSMNRLKDIADYFLVHNRRIQCRADDSVTRIFQDKPYILRRGRGLAPAPISLKRQGPQVLACGGELKNTFCLTKGSAAFMSSHVGDLENMATFGAYTAAIEHYQRLFEIQPEVVAADFHPEYLSTKYADSLPLPKILVQHHHAHIASVLAEHGLEEQVIGVAFDGTGYGADGHLWGGEFLVADCRDFTRLAKCRYMPLPGGGKAIKEPWRLAAWVLHELYGPSFANMNIPLVRRLPSGWPLAIQAAAKGINSPLTSGAGRLFDIAAAILGLRTHIYYEGQAAVELENFAAGAAGFILPYSIQSQGIYELDFYPAFAAMIEGLQQKMRLEELAAAFHKTLAVAVVDMTRQLSKLTGIRKVALSGGVFQNMTLLRQVCCMLEQEFTVYVNRQAPPNDGGVALGQAVVARERSR